jgi:hypothetical protein
MQTIGDVYHFLKSFDGDLKAWIRNHPNKERVHEAVFVILASLGLIPEVSKYVPCKGNFGTGALEELLDVEELFEESIFRGGDGGSDYSAIKRESRSILATTAKYLFDFIYEDLHMDKLVAAFSVVYPQYENKRACIVIPDRRDFEKMKAGIHQTTNSRAKVWLDNSIVIDHDDIQAAFNKFKLHKFKTTKKPSELQGVHQEYTVWKNIKMKKMGEKCVLYAHMPRSGKTFMMVGSFKADNRSNYLVITTAPNETVYDYKKACKGHGYKVTHLGAKTKPITEGKNIILVSKQFLDRHDDIDWLKDLQIDMAFVDEGHYGGTTELAQDSLRLYAPDAFTVFMSATPDKIKYAYDIPESNIIRWDQEDIKLCQNIDNPQSRIRLKEKYGPDFIEILNTFSDHQIKKKYLEYPDMHILTQSLPDDLQHCNFFFDEE